MEHTLICLSSASAVFSQHPNLLSIRDYFVRSPSESRPGHYLVMPYCVSGSLQKLLLGGGAGLTGFEDRLRIARGLMAGVACDLWLLTYDL